VFGSAGCKLLKGAGEIIREAKHNTKEAVDTFFAAAKTQFEMVTRLSDVIKLKAGVSAAMQDITCKTKYPEIPKFYKVGVPKIRCFNEALQVETNSVLQSERWKMQMNVLQSTHKTCHVNCLEVDKILINVPNDLEKSIRTMTFAMEPGVVKLVRDIAGYTYDDGARTQKILLQFRRTKKFTAQREKERVIAEKQRVAQKKLIVNHSDRMDSLRTFFHTELELRDAMQANKLDEVNDLLNQRSDHDANFAKTHLNSDGSKTRASGKRKRGNPTAATVAPQKKSTVKIKGKRGKVKVNVSIAGSAKPKGGHNTKQKPQKGTKKPKKPKSRNKAERIAVSHVASGTGTALDETSGGPRGQADPVQLTQ
jgi:hypothetical protein